MVDITPSTLTAEQIELRRSGIGSSEVAAANGICSFRSPHDLWLEKTERVERDFADNPRVEFGNRLEPVVAEKYREEHGIDPRCLRKCTTIVHPAREWMLDTCDYAIYDQADANRPDAKPIRLLEIKTSGYYSQWGDEHTDDVPSQYIAQCQWHCEVWNVDVCDLAVLLSGFMYKEYTIQRNQELIDKLIYNAEKLWYDYIRKDIEPPLDDSDGCRTMLGMKYPTHDDVIDIASQSGESLAAELRDLNDQIRGLTSRKKMITNQLLDEIGSRRGIEGEFGTLTWTERKGSVSWKAVAAEMNPPAEVIERNRKDSYRVLNTRGLH